jgi:DNA-binding winged helix-turn-helix (wHTH) protein
LLRDEKLVPVPPKVLETLLLLVENNGHVVNKEAFLQRVWPGTFVEEGNLSQNVFMLRKLLGGDGDVGHLSQPRTNP